MLKDINLNMQSYSGNAESSPDSKLEGSPSKTSYFGFKMTGAFKSKKEMPDLKLSK